MILASSDPRSVAGVVRLSQASYRTMIQNLAWAAAGNDVSADLAGEHVQIDDGSNTVDDAAITAAIDAAGHEVD